MNNLAFGANGTKIVAATGAVTGAFACIQALEDSEVTVVVNWENAGATETINISPLGSIYGIFTSVTVISGAVVAFR